MVEKTIEGIVSASMTGRDPKTTDNHDNKHSIITDITLEPKTDSPMHIKLPGKHRIDRGEKIIVSYNDAVSGQNSRIIETYQIRKYHILNEKGELVYSDNVFD